MQTHFRDHVIATQLQRSMAINYHILPIEQGNVPVACTLLSFHGTHYPDILGYTAEASHGAL